LTPTKKDWHQQQKDTAEVPEKASIEQAVEATAITAMKSKAYYRTCNRNRYYKVSFYSVFRVTDYH
jgi:hypothetical protein